MLTPRKIAYLTGLWLILAIAQSAHFHFYYEQALSKALLWGFVDWLVWVGIVTLAAITLSPAVQMVTWRSKQTLPFLTAAVGTGIVHVFSITIIYNFLGEASRPFLADIMHLLEKRWLPNIFVFCVLFILCRLLLGLENPQTTNNENPKILVNDGKMKHWVPVSEIYSVEAAGNYVAFNLIGKQLLQRSTLAETEHDLKAYGFLRVSRSALVQRHAIQNYNRVNKNRSELQLFSGQKVPIGRTYLTATRKLLEL